MKVLNAFSLNMLPENKETDRLYVEVNEVSIQRTKSVLRYKGIESCIGHTDTANILSNLIGMVIPANRVSVTLEIGEPALVCQYSGPRLPEGSTTLPEGAQFKFMEIMVLNYV